MWLSWRALALLSCTSLSLALGACADRHAEAERAWSELDLSIDFDATITADEITTYRADFVRLSRLEFEENRIRYFREIFGGESPASVLRYLDDRINYVLDRRANLDQRIVVRNSRWTGRTDEEVNVAASNIGTVLWLIQEMERPRELGLMFSDSILSLDSSRVGIILPGDGFQDLDTAFRLSIWVHEARHSDCTGGLSPSDVMRLRQGGLPESLACGHLHADCPPEHELAGLPACDEHPWGAYAVESVFAAKLAYNCGNCTLLEQQLSEVQALDSASRVLNFEAMLNGSLGEPDMSSSGVRQ